MFLPCFAALAVIVVCYFKKILEFLRDRNHINKFGARIYGPPTLPLIGNVHQLPSTPHDWCEFLFSEGEKALDAGEELYRLWIGPKLCVLPITGRALKPLVESSTEIMKGPDYDFYKLWLGDALLTSYDEKWRYQRHLLTPTFHFRQLQDYVYTLNTHSRRFLYKLDEQIIKEDGMLIDMYPLTTLFTLGVISDAIMGTDLESETELIEKYESAIRMFNHMSYKKFDNPLYWPEFLWQTIGYGREASKCLKYLKDMSRRVIEERMKLLKLSDDVNDAPTQEADKSTTALIKKTIFLDMLCEMHTNDKISFVEVQEQVDTFMFAGHDTTAHTISWLMWALACHPEIQDRCYSEICEYFPADEPLDKVDPVQLNQLKYLEQCIKESLRYFAPVPMFQRAMRNDVESGGKTIPKGSVLLISPLMTHNNKRAFPNYRTFDPDNFLPERVAQRHPYDYIPFSAGPRNCIGQRFAQLLIKILMVYFIRHYRLAADLPFEANRRKTETILMPELGIPVRLYRRQTLLGGGATEWSTYKAE